MPGPIEYAIWILSILLEVGVVVCALARHAFRRYLLLNLYMAAVPLVSIWRFNILTRFGQSSSEYFYFYYYSDALLTIGLYLALMSLYFQVFDEMNAERYLRVGALLLLAGTGLFSYLIVQESAQRLFTRFVVELSQNLYFVGVVLTYVLWGAMLKLRETRTRLIQLVLSLGLYFSAFAAHYALRNLYPGLRPLWTYLTPAFSLLLPLAWAYAFLRIPEEARLAPARLAVVRR